MTDTRPKTAFKDPEHERLIKKLHIALGHVLMADCYNDRCEEDELVNRSRQYTANIRGVLELLRRFESLTPEELALYEGPPCPHPN